MTVHEHPSARDATASVARGEPRRLGAAVLLSVRCGGQQFHDFPLTRKDAVTLRAQLDIAIRQYDTNRGEE